MTDHPQDSIPAYVLGALDADEAIQVGRHLALCAACRSEAEAFHAVVVALPYAAAGADPPPRVKRQLFARVAAEAERPSPARQPFGWRGRWMGAATAVSLVLVLALGAIAAGTRGQAATLSAQLDQARRQAATLSAQLDQSRQQVAVLTSQLVAREQVARFISAPQTLERRLDSPNQVASATMYMQPNSRHAVLIVRGLPRVASGRIYQFWLAKPGQQVPSSTFDVAQDGTAMLEIDAPAPVNQYAQVMVTVEQSGGSQQPSQQVVLSGELATAWLGPALL